MEDKDKDNEIIISKSDLEVIVDNIIIKDFCQKASEEFLDKHLIPNCKNNYIWYSISKRKNLSEDFMRKYKDKLNWTKILSYQQLSEEFLTENIDVITKSRWGWMQLCRHQTFSVDFVKANLNHIKYEWMGYNRKLGRDLKFKIRSLFKNYKDLV
jgi:hypothetical protein